MGLNRRLFIPQGASYNDTTDFFGDSTGLALYELNDSRSSSENLAGGSGYGDIGSGGTFVTDSKFGSHSLDVNGGQRASHGMAISNSDSRSISFWLKSGNLTDMGSPIEFATGNRAGIVFSNLTPGSSTYSIQGGFYTGTYYMVNTGVNLSTSSWTHVVFASSAYNNFTIYVNKTAYSYPYGTATQGLSVGRYIGWGSNAGYWHGQIDQIRLIDKKVSQSEVNQLYAETDPNP
jgi:hypothetical protein